MRFAGPFTIFQYILCLFFLAADAGVNGIPPSLSLPRSDEPQLRGRDNKGPNTESSTLNRRQSSANHLDSVLAILSSLNEAIPK
jgi:hypothetical protein